MSNTDEVLECLKVYNLEQYADDLKSNGLDTLDDMKHLNNEDIEEVCDELNMPIFHKKRFKNACDDVTNNKYSYPLSINSQDINHTEQTQTITQVQPTVTYVVTNPNQPIPVPTQTVVVLNTQQQPQQQIVTETVPGTGRHNNIQKSNNCKGCVYCCGIFLIIFIYFCIILSLHFETMYQSNGDALMEQTKRSTVSSHVDIVCYTDRLKLSNYGGNIFAEDDYKIYYFSDLCNESINNACSLADAGKVFIGFTIFSLILFTFGLFSLIIFKLKHKLVNIKVINNINHEKFEHFLLIFTMINCVLSATFLIVGCFNFVLNDSIDLCKQVFIDKYTPISTLNETNLFGGSIVLNIFAFGFLMILIIVSSIHYTRCKTK